MEDPRNLEALLDHAQDTIVVIDPEGTYLYANEAVERVLGFAPSDLVGEDALDHIHPDDREATRARFEELVASDERATETAEYRHRTADGDWVWLESLMSNSPLADLQGYVVSSRDVTDRKRAEERKRRTEARLQELAANAADVLWMFSADWSELLFVNDAYEEVWGQSVEALQADPGHFMDGIHPEDRDRVREAMELLSAGESADLEYRVNPTVDYRRWVWVKAQPVVHDGAVSHIVGFARDITHRRRRERQLRVMDNLLRHNIRNDMNVILGHAQLARDRGGPDVAESMDVVLETGSDLLATAAKEREIIRILVGIDDRSTLDVVGVLEDSIESVRTAYPRATASLEAPATAEVVALPEFRRAVDELLENAVVHADCEPVIEVTVARTDGAVEVVVRDNGPPIPGNEFRPLVGEAATTDLYHGTGLGLWLVYWVVDLSDGDIDFAGTEDGNVVTITLPTPRE